MEISAPTRGIKQCCHWCESHY